MSTKFQKKTPEKKKHKVKRYLYFEPKCKFSIMLINIIAMVPKLAKSIKCINVLNYDVEGISNTPAIDDGESESAHQATDAFKWVLVECYKMLNEGLLDKDIVSKVEIEIRNISQTASRRLQGSVDVGFMKQNRDIKNPLDKWSGTATDGLSTADYSGYNIADRFDDMRRRRNKMATDGTGQMERMKNSEAYRMQILENAKKLWEAKGKIDPSTGTTHARDQIRRDDVKTQVKISMEDIERYDKYRESMANIVTAHEPKGPLTRQPIKMGTGIM